MPTGEDIVTAARSYLEARFVHAGRNHLGIDCVGLLVCACQDCGLLEGFETEPYNRIVVSERMLTEFLAFCDVVEAGEDWKAGDVMLFAILGNAQHVGLWTGESVLHAHQAVGKVVEHRLDGGWRRRLRTVLRFRGLT